MRNTAARLFPIDVRLTSTRLRNTGGELFPVSDRSRRQLPELISSQPSLPQLGVTRGGRDGGRNFGFARGSRSSPAENGQRATMQTPQGLDAQHGGEMFPIQRE